MISFEEARDMALGLPEAEEQDHHGIPSYRVRRKIFATVPDREHLRIMVDEPDIRAAVYEDPDACREFWWGSKLACVVVELSRVDRVLFTELIVDAWRRKAPKKLVRAYDESGDQITPAAESSERRSGR